MTCDINRKNKKVFLDISLKKPLFYFCKHLKNQWLLNDLFFITLYYFYILDFKILRYD